MNIRRGSPLGFTLIEVLVALSIVSIALVAGMLASSALVGQAGRQADGVLAQLCAENELVKARLSHQMPAVGDSSIDCEQAGRTLQVTVSVLPTPNPSFRRIDAQVRDGDRGILRLSTVIGRY